MLTHEEPIVHHTKGVGTVPFEFLAAHGLIIDQSDGAFILLHGPELDLSAVGELAVLAGRPPKLRELPAPEFALALEARREKREDTAADFIAGLNAHGISVDSLPAHDLEELANQAPVVRLVNLLLSEAVEADASDVHLEATTTGLAVRYRVDGVLQSAPSPPASLQAAVLSRLKIMAELDIAERRLPQDGRIRLRHEGTELDVRVSTLPGLHGESVVLRLLRSAARGLILEEQGMASDTLDALLTFARRPHGLLLATGPTGSGKTTTLHALLQHLHTGREKIVAVEDPVEYEIAGITQVPVKPGTGLTFASALRSILRQDPDVLLVGEMRDPETAEICVQAALTGHLVLSTLHTNDAPSALTRLLDLGVPDYLVAGTVDLILAQRLVRRTCDACAVHEPLTAPVRNRLEREAPDLDSVRHGAGCPVCRGTGYRGRVGLFELLVVDEAMRSAILDPLARSSLRSLAVTQGMRTLRQDGWRLVANGITTPEEVFRVTSL
jgi:general secretion pathway protein E